MMNFNRIKKLQKEHGVDKTQNLINNGNVWLLQGSIGRNAMSMLDSGACMLPKVFHFDSYGNEVPSRDVLKKGTKGTFQNSSSFWSKVANGEFNLD